MPLPLRLILLLLATLTVYVCFCFVSAISDCNVLRTRCSCCNTSMWDRPFFTFFCRPSIFVSSFWHSASTSLVICKLIGSTLAKLLKNVLKLWHPSSRTFWKNLHCHHFHQSVHPSGHFLWTEWNCWTWSIFWMGYYPHQLHPVQGVCYHLRKWPSWRCCWQCLRKSS